MKIFTSTTFTWWQLGLFKISMISLGIILGVYFQAFFLRWIVIVTILFVALAIYITKVWWDGKADKVSNVQ
jgi:hypothetical protein